MLAFVKLRAVGGDIKLAKSIENETRAIIHKRAAAVDPAQLKDETSRVRLALEQKKSRPHRGKEIDIKYGPGGMLDVYFAMRFLQLRDNVPDDISQGSPPYEGGEAVASAGGVVLSDRSTSAMLDLLEAKGSLTAETHAGLVAGYEFLSALDHSLRLIVGRTTRLPLANESALKTIAARMNLASSADLLEQLTLHRLAIRAAFENILG